MPRPEDEAFEEYDDEPPRRSRRRHDDDDDDEPPRRRIKKEMNWLDKQFTNTSIILLVLFPLCCGMFALAFGIVGIAACTDPKARKNAILVTVISVAWVAVFTVIQLIRVFSKARF